MAEPTGNVAQVTDEEVKKPTKKTGGKKASKPKAKAKPEPEKVEAAAPEPEPAAEPEPETNGEKQVEEVVAESTTQETMPAEGAIPTTERAINEKIQQDRQDLTQKMYGGQVEESTLTGKPTFIEASIFPDAYCPLCGQKLSGNSKTGFKQAFYTHPFSPSITLGRPCELKGKQFRAPTARMEIVE